MRKVEYVAAVFKRAFSIAHAHNLSGLQATAESQSERERAIIVDAMSSLHAQS